MFIKVEPEILQKYNLNNDILEVSTIISKKRDAKNSNPFKEELIIINMEDIE